jgi:hypothetical protein
VARVRGQQSAAVPSVAGRSAWECLAAASARAAAWVPGRACDRVVAAGLAGARMRNQWAR